MDLQQIKANDYKVFDSYGESKGRAVAAIKYIEKLSALSNTDISRWDMIGLLKKKDSEFITFDKNKINELFFGFRAIAPQRKTNISDANIKNLNELYNRRGASAIGTLRDQLMNKEQNAKYEYDQYLAFIKQAITIRRQIETLENSPRKSYVDMIEAIEKDGFWSFNGAGYESKSMIFTTQSFISFKTVNDVVLSYVNEKAGAKHQVNFGKFICHYEVSSGSLYAEREHEENIRTSDRHGSMHPHITSSGQVCIGEMKQEYISAKTMADLVAIFDILKKTLLTYYDNSCYETIESFAKRSVDGCVNLKGKINGPQEETEEGEEDDTDDNE